LFASSNVLLIKLEKKLPKNEVEELIKACNTNENSYVIFACMKDSEFKTMQNYFTLKNSAVGVRFFSLFAKEAMQLLEQEAKLLNLKYDVSALHHLYFMHRNDLSLCMNDLKKLSIVDEIITSKVVNQHCFGFGAVSLEEFLYKLLSKQIINEDVNALLNEGANEIYLITQITAYIQQLFMINAYIKTNGRADAKEILGFMPPKKIWDDKCKIAMSIKPTEFLRMFEFMNGLELELKTLKINDQNAYLQASLRKFTVLFR
jgi:DNA polymerase-3 subunit delta